jgi:hypothetical protein
VELWAVALAALAALSAGADHHDAAVEADRDALRAVACHEGIRHRDRGHAVAAAERPIR